MLDFLNNFSTPLVRSASKLVISKKAEKRTDYVRAFIEHHRAYGVRNMSPSVLMLAPL